MTTLYYGLVLGLFAVGAYIIMPILLGLACAPGALFAGQVEKASRKRFNFALSLAVLGQSYLYLGFVAFLVSWTMLAVQKPDVIGFLLWPIAFGVALGPAKSSFFDAERERRKVNGPSSVQIGAVCVTLLISNMAFFVFAFWPAAMKPLWGWLPFVSSLSV